MHHPLYLSGFDVKLRVSRQSRAEVEFVDGHDSGFNRKESTSRRYRPRELPYSSLVIDARSGYLSIGGLRRLAKEQVPIFLTEPDGSILYSILPPAPLKPDVRIAQVQAANDSKRKFTIAHALVKAKIARSLQVLDWLAQRYDIEREVRTTKHETMKLPYASLVAQLRTLEGRTALGYWTAIQKILPKSLEFHTRMSSIRLQRSNNANDPVNTFLNWGYAYLEGELRRAVNSVGLEAGIGFLHVTADYQTKEALIFDLIEPYRWIVDLSVLHSVETKLVGWGSVYFAEPDFKCRLDNGAKEKFIGLLRERFNERVPYKGQRLTWSSIIVEKCEELARYLAGKSRTIDFTEPSPTLQRFDDKELRDRILSLSIVEAKQLGIPKQSLHDLRRKARDHKPFKLYRENRQRLLA
jgi:CRISPR-associated protein Cas1